VVVNDVAKVNIDSKLVRERTSINTGINNNNKITIIIIIIILVVILIIIIITNVDQHRHRGRGKLDGLRGASEWLCML
jgi:hypothetical protein